MWIELLGASGTGKHSIAKILKQDGYEVIESKKPSTDIPSFETEYDFLVGRLRAQLQAQAIKNRKNVITVHSIFESEHVFLPIAQELAAITEAQRDHLVKLTDEIKDLIEPPNAVIWSHVEPIQAFSRMSMRGVRIDQTKFNREIALFETLARKIRVPLVEIDTGVDFENWKKNLEFSVASLRTTSVSGTTMWRQEYLR